MLTGCRKNQRMPAWKNEIYWSNKRMRSFFPFKYILLCLMKSIWSGIFLVLKWLRLILLRKVHFKILFNFLIWKKLYYNFLINFRFDCSVICRRRIGQLRFGKRWVIVAGHFHRRSRRRRQQLLLGRQVRLESFKSNFDSRTRLGFTSNLKNILQPIICFASSLHYHW